MYIYHGKQLSIEHYHGVPAGWRASEIRREHSKLNGTYDLDGPDVTEPGAPSFLVHRYDWLQYRATLYRIVDGVRAGDAACVELGVRFIVLHHIGSYSGYIRARLTRVLKKADLNESQQRRLQSHFLRLLANGEKVDEFSDYIRLWRLFLTRDQRANLLLEVQAQTDGDAKANWLSARLG